MPRAKISTPETVSGVCWRILCSREWAFWCFVIRRALRGSTPDVSIAFAHIAPYRSAARILAVRSASCATMDRQESFGTERAGGAASGSPGAGRCARSKPIALLLGVGMSLPAASAACCM